METRRTAWIPLVGGGAASVDEADQPLVAPFRWYGSEAGAYTTIEGKQVLMHRLIVHPSDDMLVVHVNGRKLDNRRFNLEVVPRGLTHLIERTVYHQPHLVFKKEEIEYELSELALSFKDAEKMRFNLIREIKDIEKKLGDKVTKYRLQPHEYKKWRGSLVKIRDIKLEALHTIKAWLREYSGVRRLPSSIEHLRTVDTFTLLVHGYTVAKTLAQRLDWKLSPEEQGVLDIIEHHIEQHARLTDLLDRRRKHRVKKLDRKE